MRPGQSEPGTRLAGGQPRPPDEILQRRRAVTGEVPARELRQRFLAGQRLGRRNPLVQQRERVLVPFARAEADQAVVRTVPQDVRAAALTSPDAGALEPCVEARPGLLPIA